VIQDGGFQDNDLYDDDTVFFYTVSAPLYTTHVNCKDERWNSLDILKNMIGSALTKLPPTENHAPMELSLRLTDDTEIQQLNKDFRQKDYATNVLSFPDGENGYLGDIAISYDRVVEESHHNGKDFNDHFVHLFIHGCLHLMGYDHETEEDALQMEALEVKILQDMGIKNPYN